MNSFPGPMQCSACRSRDVYEAFFANLGLNKVVISDKIVKDNKKLLSGGVWCIVTMGGRPIKYYTFPTRRSVVH